MIGSTILLSSQQVYAAGDSTSTPETSTTSTDSNDNNTNQTGNSNSTIQDTSSKNKVNGEKPAIYNEGKPTTDDATIMILMLLLVIG